MKPLKDLRMIAALLMVTPGIASPATGPVVVWPMLLRRVAAWRAKPPSAAPA